MRPTGPHAAWSVAGGCPPTGDRSMKFVMLIYETPAQLRERQTGREGAYVAGWRAYYHALLAANAYVTGAPLKDVATATTVRVKDGRRLVQDGTYAEAKAQRGGVVLLAGPPGHAAHE